MARQTLSLKGAEDRAYKNNLQRLYREEPTFRKFLWNIITDAGIYVPTIVPRDAVSSAFYAGKQAMGLEVLHLMENSMPGFLGALHTEFGVPATTRPNPQRTDDAPPPDDDDERELPPSA